MQPRRCVYCARVRLQTDLLGPARTGSCPARNLDLGDVYQVILCHQFEPDSGESVVKRFARSKSVHKPEP